jgi:SAM-dependent methyltransferase
MADDLDRHAPAYGESFPFHDENNRMLAGYAARMLASIGGKSRLRWLSLGVGHQVVIRTLLERLSGALDRFVILEGAPALIESLRREVDLPPLVEPIETMFETYEAAEPFDVIEMGFVLEHVDDPLALLRRYRDQLREGGALFAAVPNARSLHRLVGQAAGLLDDVFALSPADHQLGHKRYFDQASFTAMVVEAGFRIVRTEGILLKPLTTRQLDSLGLSPAILGAFDQVAAGLPGISNAIFIEATC